MVLRAAVVFAFLSLSLGACRNSPSATLTEPGTGGAGSGPVDQSSAAKLPTARDGQTSGRVVAVTASNLVLDSPDLGEKEMKIPSTVRVTVDNRPASLMDVHEGMGVRAAYRIDVDGTVTVTGIDVGQTTRF
jgi:hypothetical protein